MSNRKLIERLRGQFVMSKYLTQQDLYRDMFDAMEKAAAAIQLFEWNTDMEAIPKKARAIELLPESGEVILISGGAWMRISTPEEIQ